MRGLTGRLTSVSIFVLAAALTAAGMSGCGKQAEAPSGQSPPGGGAAPQGLPERGAVFTAACEPGAEGRGGVVTVDAWDTQSFKHLAAVSFTLPPEVSTSGRGYRTPEWSGADLCDSSNNVLRSDQAVAMRSLFNRDFSRMAVMIFDPKTEQSHAAIADRSGKLTDFGAGKGFGMTLHEEHAVISPDGNTVYFTYPIKEKPGLQVASRSGSAEAKPLGTAGSRNDLALALVGGAAVVTVSRTRLDPSPDGMRLLVDGRAYTMPLGTVADFGPLDPQPKGESMCKTSEGLGWIDDQTVLCTAPGNNFAASSDPARTVLPATDRAVEGLILSPDRKRLIFAAVQGNTTELFVCEIKPGCSPAEVSLGKKAVFIEWR